MHDHTDARIAGGKLGAMWNFLEGFEGRVQHQSGIVVVVFGIALDVVFHHPKNISRVAILQKITVEQVVDIFVNLRLDEGVCVLEDTKTRIILENELVVREDSACIHAEDLAILVEWRLLCVAEMV